MPECKIWIERKSSLVFGNGLFMPPLPEVSTALRMMSPRISLIQLECRLRVFKGLLQRLISRLVPSIHVLHYRSGGEERISTCKIGVQFNGPLEQGFGLGIGFLRVHPMFFAASKNAVICF